MRGATVFRNAAPIIHHDFNPRAPCGARPSAAVHTGSMCPFQSTRPMRGATWGDQPHLRWGVFQSTRPMRGATAWLMSNRSAPRRFQSTRPMRGATKPSFPAPRPTMISIHAPHAGRDCRGSRLRGRCGQISIHAPHAGRDGLPCVTPTRPVRFQSTRPMRGATVEDVNSCMIVYKFQSTRPMRGATRIICTFECLLKFQSTRPMRGAT